MTSLWKALTSSIGKKVVVGVTRLAMLLFLVGHVIGNLLVFTGADTYNEYSDKLISNPLLVPIELVLIAMLLPKRN